MGTATQVTRTTKGTAVHTHTLSVLAKLGQDIATARKARTLSTQDMAERMGVDRGTLRRLEQGDPGVALNTLVMALTVLGLDRRLSELLDIARDDVALLGAQARLPQRITRPRATPTTNGTDGPRIDGPENTVQGW
jgi:transcriptional regulator with XRE-family HTH domain